MDKRGYRRAVRVIIEREGKILLGKSYKGKDEDRKLIYLFPGGGIDAGESVEEAAIKESKEEVGLAVDNVRPIGHESKFDREFEQPERTKLYRGSHDIWVCASYNGKDTSELGSQGDAFKYGWFTLEEVVNVFSQLPDDPGAQGNLAALKVYRRFLDKVSLECYPIRQPLPVW